MISKSLTFWTLLAGLAAFILRWYFPTFPLDQVAILALILFILGLVGIIPQLRIQGALTGNIVNSLAFWQLVAGFVVFVFHFFAPTFPFDQAVILTFLLFILGFFGVYPELRARGLLIERSALATSPVDGLTDGLCQLQVLTDDANDGLPAIIWKTSVLFDADGAPNTWHWIERA